MATIAQIMQYMRANNHIGRSNPITAYLLANHFNISDNGVEVGIRNIIRDAINNGELIGSNNKGFFLIDSINDLDYYLNSLESRAHGIINRRNNLIRNWNNSSNTNTTKQIHTIQ